MVETLNPHRFISSLSGCSSALVWSVVSFPQSRLSSLIMPTVFYPVGSDQMKWLKPSLSKAKEWIIENRKAVLIVVGSLVCIGLLFIAIWKVPELLVRGYHGKLDSSAISKLTPQELIQLQKDLITAENNARMTFAQTLGGIALLFGLALTYRNIKVTEEGKLTERFSKAVELLGNKDNIEIRLGGIYALERIARDSRKDHWTVMEVLTAFVREQSRKEYRKYIPNAQHNSAIPTEKDFMLREDIQAALTVIGRRKWFKQEPQSLNLSNSFLGRASLFDANLRNAYLSNTSLWEANLMDAKLNNATLFNSNLIGAVLQHANLTDADFTYANLIRADLRNTNLTGADLSTSKGIVEWYISGAIIDETTNLPPEIEKRHKVENVKDVRKYPFQDSFAFDEVRMTATDVWMIIHRAAKPLTLEEIASKNQTAIPLTLDALLNLILWDKVKRITDENGTERFTVSDSTIKMQ
jgi:Pentapeptide repeats (8 copies)